MEPDFPKYLKICTLDNLISNRNSMIRNFIKLLAEILHFSYEFIASKDGYLGHRLPDGNISGIFGMIESGECDISMDMFAVSESRLQAADFSYPYHFTDVTFITHKPKKMAKSFAIFYPFSFEVWIALILLLLFMSLAFYAGLDKKKDFHYVLMVLFGNFMWEPFNYRFDKLMRKRLSHTLVSLSFIIGVFFVTASYLATLLSFLTLPTYTGIRNSKDLAKAAQKGTATCITRKGSFLPNDFMASSEESLIAIGKCLANNAATAMDIEEFLDNYDSGVYITARTNIRPFEHKYFISEDSYFPVIVGVAVPKTFRYNKILDKVIMRINEAYLYEKIVNDVVYLSSIKKSSEVKELASDHEILLEDVSGSFAILAVGYILGIIVLCLEIISVKKKFRMKQKFKK